MKIKIPNKINKENSQVFVELKLVEFNCKLGLQTNFVNYRKWNNNIKEEFQKKIIFNHLKRFLIQKKDFERIG